MGNIQPQLLLQHLGLLDHPAFAHPREECLEMGSKQVRVHQGARALVQADRRKHQQAKAEEE